MRLREGSSDRAKYTNTKENKMELGGTFGWTRKRKMVTKASGLTRRDRDDATGRWKVEGLSG